VIAGSGIARHRAPQEHAGIRCAKRDDAISAPRRVVSITVIAIARIEVAAA
jgi:hypothetical protein